MTSLDYLEYLIADVEQFLNALKACREIAESGNCNTCARMNSCEYQPGHGELTRYNCPHYSKKEVQ